MSYSAVTYVSDGVTSEFTINFALGYISEDHIKAWVTGELDSSGNKVYRGLTFISRERVRLQGPVPAAGVIIEFSRVVPKSEQIIVFGDGDTLDEDNLDVSQKQAMMATHEALDKVKSLETISSAALAAAVSSLKAQIDKLAAEVVFIFVEKDESGSSDAKHFVHTQNVAASEWVINHNMNTYPGVTAYDESGGFMLVSYAYSTLNQITLSFDRPRRGVAYVH